VSSTPLCEHSDIHSGTGSRSRKSNLNNFTLHQNKGRPLTQEINKYNVFYVSFILSGVRQSLGTAVTTGLLYQPQMMGDVDCGEIGGMKIGREYRSTRRKPAPASLCPPQISQSVTISRETHCVSITKTNRMFFRKPNAAHSRNHEQHIITMWANYWISEH
jgi:hypothetical protein